MKKTDDPLITSGQTKRRSGIREQGMGIGLSVVKWVINSHGWTINAASDSMGTRFVITLPVKNNTDKKGIEKF
jgi:signal transduction histidine kinase